MAYPRNDVDTIDKSLANHDKTMATSKTATNGRSNGHNTTHGSPTNGSTTIHEADTVIGDDEYGEETLLWYFSYGSNMNPAVFEEKRKIQPLDHRVCKVPGHVLSYLESCLPYAEPAFCTCLARSQVAPGDARPDIHGVAFLITRRQYEHVLMTEGGWGYQECRNHPLWSTGHYGEQAIECMEIAPQEGCCERMPKSIVPGRTFQARTLVGLSGLRERYDCHASKRYNDLVQDGAKSSGLPQDYQQYLKDFHPSFRPVQNCWKTSIAKTVYLMAAFPVFIPEFSFASFCNGRAEKQLLRWTKDYQQRRKEKEQETSETTTTSTTKIKEQKRKPFEGVRRAPWIVLKLFFVVRTIWLELIVIPLLFDVCKCRCGWYNAKDAPGDEAAAAASVATNGAKKEQ